MHRIWLPCVLSFACGTSGSAVVPHAVSVVLPPDEVVATRLHVSRERVCVERSNGTFLCAGPDGVWEEETGSTCLDGGQQCSTHPGGVRCTVRTRQAMWTIDGLRGATNLVCAGLHVCGTMGGRVSCQPFPPVNGLTEEMIEESYFLPRHTFPSPTEVAINTHLGCLRDSDGLRCWWRERDTYAEEPLAIRGRVDQFAIGDGPVCWVDAKAVLCVGPNGFGQLGPNHREVRFSATPVEVARFDETPVVSAHDITVCLGAGPSARCWGNAGLPRQPPREVSLPGNVSLLAQTTDRVCAVLDTGCVFCWTDSTSPEPQQVGACRF